jgi:choline kinase
MDVSRAVILAAGGGTRLGWRTLECPKPLLPLLGRPIIAYTIEALAAAGVRDICVVVGYRAQLMHAALGDGAALGVNIRYVLNPAYREGASLSLAAARAATGDAPFLLAMSDHLHDAAVFSALLARAGDDCLVAAEFAHERRTPQYIAEATKIEVDDQHYVTAIGKGITDWTALDAGAFICTPEVWDAIDAAPPGCELHPVFSHLAGRRRLRAIDIGPAHWHDVDTEADLDEALLGMDPVYRGL